MSNHITIEFCQEDRKRIDELIGMAGWIAGALKDMAAQPQGVAEPAKKLELVNEHPVDDVSPHAAPEPVAEPTAPKWTKDDVQALVIKLAAPGTGKKDAARAIVYEYAKKVSDIPEDKLDEVMAKLSKLAEKE